MNALQIESRPVSPGIRQGEEEKNEEFIAPVPIGPAESTDRGTNRTAREHLLDTIAHVQRQFFQSASPHIVFGCLLEGLLDLMKSEYGFIGEIKYEEDGTMFLQTHAITNIAWNQATRQFYEDNIDAGRFSCIV